MSTSCLVSEKLKNICLSKETFLLVSVLLVAALMIKAGKFYSILCIN